MLVATEAGRCSGWSNSKNGNCSCPHPQTQHHLRQGYAASAHGACGMPTVAPGHNALPAGTSSSCYKGGARTACQVADSKPSGASCSTTSRHAVNVQQSTLEASSYTRCSSGQASQGSSIPYLQNQCWQGVRQGLSKPSWQMVHSGWSSGATAVGSGWRATPSVQLACG